MTKADLENYVQSIYEGGGYLGPDGNTLHYGDGDQESITDLYGGADPLNPRTDHFLVDGQYDNNAGSTGYIHDLPYWYLWHA